jgi:hypothetical protein
MAAAQTIGGEFGVGAIGGNAVAVPRFDERSGGLCC